MTKVFAKRTEPCGAPQFTVLPVFLSTLLLPQLVCDCLRKLFNHFDAMPITPLFCPVQKNALLLFTLFYVFYSLSLYVLLEKTKLFCVQSENIL